MDNATSSAIFDSNVTDDIPASLQGHLFPTCNLKSGSAYNHLHDVVFAVGLISALENGFLLIILSYFAENRRNTTNILIINQTVIELLGSVAIIIAHFPRKKVWTFSNDSLGHALCDLFYGSTVLGTAVLGDAANLTVIAIERYIKIVHSVMHRKYYRPWMIYIMVAAPWVGAVICAVSSVIPTTIIVDGRCCPLSYFLSPAL